MANKYIAGGVGDMLLSLGQADGPIDIYSHFRKARSLMEQFGVQVDKVGYYNEGMPKTEGDPLPMEQMPSWAQSFYNVQRRHKPHTDMPLIGLHPFGSEYSQKVWGKDGWPAKRISNESIEHILTTLETQYQFIVFGSASEIAELGHLQDHKAIFKTTTDTDMYESLSMVTWCDAMIATDSVMKTMSAICKIPTYVFMGNYVDKYRDNIFIDPYIRNGTMKVWQFVRCTPELFEPAINELLLNR